MDLHKNSCTYFYLSHVRHYLKICILLLKLSKNMHRSIIFHTQDRLVPKTNSQFIRNDSSKKKEKTIINNEETTAPIDHEILIYTPYSFYTRITIEKRTNKKNTHNIRKSFDLVRRKDACTTLVLSSSN